MVVDAKWGKLVVVIEPPPGVKISAPYKIPPTEQSIRSTLEGYGTIIDVQFYTFKAEWTTVFVTFEDPHAVRSVLKDYSYKRVHIGEMRLSYQIRLMDRNRVQRYKPPYSDKDVHGPRRQFETASPSALPSSPGSTVPLGNTPRAPRRWAVSANAASNPSADTPKRIEPPSGPRVMLAMPMSLTKRTPSASSPADSLSRRATGSTTQRKLRGPQKTVPVSLTPQLMPPDQIGLFLAEMSLLSNMLKEAESLRDAKRSHIAQQSTERMKLIELQAAAERSKRKSLERAERDLLRELDELGNAHRREVKLTKRAEEKLKQISQHRRTGVQMENQDHIPMSSHLTEVNQAQEEVNALAAYLANLNSKIASEEEAIAKLRHERELLLPPKPSPVLPGNQPGEQESAVIPAFNSALAALNTISKNIVAQLGQPDERHRSPTDSSGAAKNPQQVLKRRHSDTLE